MGEFPTLRTERLVLRAFKLSDAADVQRMAGAREIASPTINIPHPYEDGMAELWISSHRGASERGELVPLAITLSADGTLIGAISLGLDQSHERAELGYWIGAPYWGQGYCTEAARAILGYGFGVLGLHRIHSSHFARNPASGRVMQKLGMTREGCLRHHVKKWDAFEDLAVYGLLREEWEAMT
ncbi:MAG TPA: GNAT family N-acetyltransferase [Anaerolineae bacterium]|nr:GNAT family N-acetyltransferase [Anaerolineae bacterium]